MNLNSDFGARAAVHAARLDWTPSPIPRVDRRMLDRIGDEVARATSIVRYTPHSHFAPHTHGGGEEFLVLDGVFQDEHGDYPKGTYVRNPPGSSHAPFSQGGCTIFVKLRQFRADDTRALVARPPLHALYTHESEDASIVDLAAGETLRIEARAPGVEIFVLSGEIETAHGRLARWGWLRDPAPATTIRAIAPSCAWLKRGHL